MRVASSRPPGPDHGASRGQPPVMRKETLWRSAIVAAVTLFCLVYVTPTFRYFLAVSGKVAATPKQLEDLRANSVPLGLDLQGGVDVLLAVDLEKAKLAKAEAIAEDMRLKFRNQSPAIDASLEVTTLTATGPTDPGVRVNLKLAKPEQARSVDNILLALQKNANEFPAYVAGSVTAGAALSLVPNPVNVKSDAEATVESSWKLLRDRVDKLGVTQPVVVKQGTDRIRVQIPGEKDPQKVVATIIKPAVLDFRGVLTDRAPSPEGRYLDASGEFIDLKTGKALPGKAIPGGYTAYPMKREGANPNATPEERRKAATTPDHWILLERKVRMKGDGVKDAGVSFGQSSIGASEIQVNLEFNRAGADKFSAVTAELINKPLAIVLDGVVYSAPNINQRISEGRAQISGNFNQEEAHDLALVLKAGALPAELKTLDQRAVEATLGADSIRSSVTALAVGSVIVAIVMISYYGGAGVIAVFAMIVNVLLVFAFMRMAGATLTLSGIGGILLTVGMAVDANILIYERVREELRAGKNIRQAVNAGFGRAFTVIWDTNITTLISGMTLLQFGEGSVKGFALSLNIGIVASLFTGLFVTRTLVDLWLERGGKLGVGSFQWFKDGLLIDFIGMRKISFTFSAVLFAICALYLTPVVKGINWGVDFDGGVLAEVRTTKNMESAKVQGNFADMRVQKVAGVQEGGGSQYLIRIKTEGRGIAETKAELTKRLDANVGAGQHTTLGLEAVSNEVGKEFTWKAIMACLIASGLILSYIAFRFEFSYGLAAVIALFHDLVITFGLYNMLGGMHLAGEVTLDVVAALLVVLGFSVHDTIIILDRVRENRRLHPGMEMRQLINRSISESLNRTVMTVSTVLMVLLTMLVLGGAGLYDFALVLFIGILKGTYSSSFVAAPILYELYLRAQRMGKDIHTRVVKNPEAGKGGKPSGGGSRRATSSR